MDQQKQKFGLLTTISMIVGVVIGSGIFFKTDDILVATGNNPLLGGLVLTIGAFGIIFGGLSVSTFAKKTSEAGGLITYIEYAWGKTFGFLAGWFQAFFYYPAIIAILCFVAATYTGLLLNIPNVLDIRIWTITFLYIAGAFLLNVLNTSGAGRFQNITLAIKLIALLALACAGFMVGDVSNLTPTPSALSQTPHLFTGLVACAFSYDGWFVAPSVAHEIKDPKRNLSRALIVAPLIILAVYLFYFFGISASLGPERIVALGDDSVGMLAELIGGLVMRKVVYICVIVSIVGAINGLILGYIRLPYALSLRESFPFAHKFSHVNKRLDIPVYSALLSFILTLLWLWLHALSVFKVSIGSFSFSGLRIDSLPIVLTYFFYLALFAWLIIHQWQTRTLGIKFGFIYPLLASFGSFLIIYGGMSEPGALIYFFISFMGILLGYVVMQRMRRKHQQV